MSKRIKLFCGLINGRVQLSENIPLIVHKNKIQNPTPTKQPYLHTQRVHLRRANSHKTFAIEVANVSHSLLFELQNHSFTSPINKSAIST
jgi:hypothetical protein